MGADRDPGRRAAAEVFPAGDRLAVDPVGAPPSSAVRDEELRAPVRQPGSGSTQSAVASSTVIAGDGAAAEIAASPRGRREAPPRQAAGSRAVRRARSWRWKRAGRCRSAPGRASARRRSGGRRERRRSWRSAAATRPPGRLPDPGPVGEVAAAASSAGERGPAPRGRRPPARTASRRSSRVRQGASNHAPTCIAVTSSGSARTTATEERPRARQRWSSSASVETRTGSAQLSSPPRSRSRAASASGSAAPSGSPAALSPGAPSAEAMAATQALRRGAAGAERRDSASDRRRAAAPAASCRCEPAECPERDAAVHREGPRVSVRGALEERLALMAPARRLRLALADQVLSARLGERPVRVLDAGCGDGLLSLALAKRHPEWTFLGARPARGHARAARARGPRRAASPTSSSKPADLRSRCRAEGMDAVIALECLSEIPDDEQALRMMAGALAPGGLLVAQVPERGWRPVLRAAPRPGASRSARATPLRSSPPCCARAGLEPVEVRRPTAPRRRRAGAAGPDQGLRPRGANARLPGPGGVRCGWSGSGVTWGQPNAILAVAAPAPD